MGAQKVFICKDSGEPSQEDLMLDMRNNKMVGRMGILVNITVSYFLYKYFWFYYLEIIKISQINKI